MAILPLFLWGKKQVDLSFDTQCSQNRSPFFVDAGFICMAYRRRDKSVFDDFIEGLQTLKGLFVEIKNRATTNYNTGLIPEIFTNPGIGNQLVLR